MRKIMLSLTAVGVLADSVDKVLSDEQSKIDRLNKIKEVAVTKIVDIEQETTNLTNKLEEDIKAINLKIRTANMWALENKQALQLEIQKADKAIERLSKVVL